MAAQPIVDTQEAVADVRRAVEFILARRGLARLDLVGYSWGSAIAGQLAGEIPEKIRRLVLAGALWVMDGRSQAGAGGQLGAYRTVDAEAVVRRWTAGLNEQQRAAIAPPERLQRWAEAVVASDPESAAHDPPRLRAPAGVIKDVQTFWLRGRPTYDPARIRCPTLVVVGEWDRETTPAQGRALFEHLTGSARRRYTVIGCGSHSLLLEEQRHELYHVVAGFLADPQPEPD
jgi:pimeloyl-ACP methyl ester carboxylesterase